MWTNQIVRSSENVDQEEDWWLFYLQLKNLSFTFSPDEVFPATSERCLLYLPEAYKKNEISAKDGDTDCEKKEIHNEQNYFQF